jgi:transcriptional regulator with XRE-family HTH domain
VSVPPEHLKLLGSVIRRERRAQDLSQEALGHAAGVAGKHVSEIERANRDPRFTTLLQIARALGLTPGQLFASYDEQDERGPRL